MAKVEVTLKQPVALRLDPDFAKLLGVDPRKPFVIRRGCSVVTDQIARHWAVRANRENV